MTEKPYISKIRVYPVKSLDAIELTESNIGIHSLKHDRAFAMVTNDGRYVNGKSTSKVAELKTSYDLEKGSIFLCHRNANDFKEFELKENNKELNLYLSQFFDTEVTLIHRTQGELMDIPRASSITVVSEASLKSIHKDLNTISLENLRLRFRTNIELAGVPAFWEEKLFKTPSIGMQFKLGNVDMIGVSPRARCNVPPKDPFTGESNHSFAKNMMKSRINSLPEDSGLGAYGSLYHLAVNTYVPETAEGKLISLGDTVKILDPINLR